MDAFIARGETQKCKELLERAQEDGQDSAIVEDKVLAYLEKVDPAGYLLALLEMARRRKRISNIKINKSV